MACHMIFPFPHQSVIRIFNFPHLPDFSCIISPAEVSAKKNWGSPIGSLLILSEQRSTLHSGVGCSLGLCHTVALRTGEARQGPQRPRTLKSSEGPNLNGSFVFFCEWSYHMVYANFYATMHNCRKTSL